MSKDKEDGERNVMKKDAFQKSFQDFFFLLFTFGSGVFYLCFYLTGITVSFGLMAVFIGFPLLTKVLRTTHTFVQYERIQTKVYADLSIEPTLPMAKNGGSQWEQARQEMLDHKNWRAIYWLTGKFFIGLVSLICAVILYVAPVLFILTPIFFQYVELQVWGFQINTWEIAIGTMIAGFLLAGISSRIGSGLVQMLGGYTRSMFDAMRG